MLPIHFTYNRSSWDDTTETVLPGSMCDRINGPVIAELEARGYEVSVGRNPIDGALNLYSSARSAHDYQNPVGEISVLMSHGIADKGIRANLCRQFDFVICPSVEHQGPLINRIGKDRAPVLGYPKLDPLLRGEVEPLPRDERIRVLYAPTHGGGGERKHWDDPTDPGIPASQRTSWWRRDEVLSQLDPKVFDVVECWHPRYKPGHVATFAEYVNADVVIADGGSTLWESMILGIPLVVPRWITEAGHARKLNLEGDLYSRHVGRHAIIPDQLADLVTDAATHGQTRGEVKFGHRVLHPQHRGTSAAHHADWIVALLKAHR